ncbi:MAG: DnaD domain protein [Bacillota bacterium]|nr:DnaD domain protein [Bacillota bacterium]
MGFKREKTDDYFLLDTAVENVFINEYMAMAPGDFVKIYLLALMYADLDIPITNEEIARHLSLDHEDVLKAWTYWEKLGVIRKKRTDAEDKFNYDVEFILLKEQLYGEKEKKKTFSSDQNVQSFMADKEIQDMFAAIEKISGRVISGTEMMEVISWINDFHVSPEVIVYGYSYCVQRKKKNIKYIAAVVSQWAREGLGDVIAVEKYLSQQDKKQHLYKRVFQALGFARNATEEEKRIMDTWFENMGFSLERVLSACSKTSGISSPNINYVNKVLTNWYEEQTGNASSSGHKKDLTTGDIMRYYEKLRQQEEEAAEARRREVFEKVPRIKEIEEEAKGLSAEISKLIISDSVNRKKSVARIKDQMDALNTEKAFLLTDNGFELDHMDVRYTCSQCKDTGMLETGERCQCFGEVTKEKIELITKQKTE